MSHLLGGAWGEEQPSAARMDAKDIFVGTGADIANITITSTIPYALCTEDGSGFLRNHVYSRHFDPEENSWTGWDDIFRKHTHSEDNETTGGDYYDIDIANSDVISIRRSVVPDLFLVVPTGAGAAATLAAPTGTHRTMLQTSTGATTGSPKSVMLQDGGVKLSLSSRVQWHAKFAVEGAATGILWRMGVGLEKITENSESTLQKFGIEGCAGDGTTIQLVSCDGQTRLKTNTAVAYGSSTSMGVKVDYVPSTSVIYYDTIGTIKPSTGNFPSSGAVDSDKMLRYGVKSTVTNEKFMYISYDALFAKILDVSWI